MITLFTVPKAFEGRAAIHQCNALRSWTTLPGSPEVILFGDDPGVAEAAASFAVRHEPQVPRSPEGTPLLEAPFALAQATGRHAVVCYLNADILLPPAFVAAVARVAAWRPRFLTVAQRLEVDVPDDRVLEDDELQTVLIDAPRSAPLAPKDAIDVFAFPRGAIGAMLPFAVGRPGWDNWTIWRARSRRIAVVDVTADAPVVHQRHGYEHAGGHTRVWKGDEAERNRALADGHVFTIADATHLLADGAVQRAWTWNDAGRRAAQLARADPVLRRATAPLRGARRALRRRPE